MENKGVQMNSWTLQKKKLQTAFVVLKTNEPAFSSWKSASSSSSKVQLNQIFLFKKKKKTLFKIY